MSVALLVGGQREGNHQRRMSKESSQSNIVSPAPPFPCATILPAKRNRRAGSSTDILLTSLLRRSQNKLISNLNICIDQLTTVLHTRSVPTVA